MAFLTGLPCCLAGPAILVLFDSAPATTPVAQGWTYLPSPFFGSKASQSLSAAGARLDTATVITDKAGYFSSGTPFTPHPKNPVLKRNPGFKIAFGASLLSETHNSLNRAGLSLIVLSEDLKGVELGFWTNLIFAQSGPDFLHAEEGLADTTVAGSVYELLIKGETYSLSRGGAVLLTGPLRDYSPFGAPYNTANFIFVGDDTSSASAVFDWTLLSYEPLSATSPAMLGAIGFSEAGFKISVSGVEGSAQRIEYSEDLGEWHELQSITLGASVAEVLDTTASAALSRYYRAVSQ